MEGENEDACSEIRRLCKELKEGQERIERILDRIPDRTEYFKQLKKNGSFVHWNFYPSGHCVKKQIQHFAGKIAFDPCSPLGNLPFYTFLPTRKKSGSAPAFHMII